MDTYLYHNNYVDPNRLLSLVLCSLIVVESVVSLNGLINFL